MQQLICIFPDGSQLKTTKDDSDEVKKEIINKLANIQNLKSDDVGKMLNQPAKNTTTFWIVYDKICEFEGKTNQASTKKKYASIIKEFEAYYTSVKNIPCYLTEIEHQDVDNYVLEELQNGNQYTTIKYKVNTLEYHFKRAVEKGLIPKMENPFSDKAPKKGSYKGRGFFEDFQLKTYFNKQLADSSIHSPVLFVAVLLILTTGMRKMELLSLTTDNIKTENDFSYIDLSVSKTKAGTRKIPLC